MTRREIREHLVKMLYCEEFHDAADMPEQIEMYVEKAVKQDEDIDYLIQRLKNINDNIEEIDNVISENCVGWKISRIAKVDLSILRLAVYEIKFDESIPDKVAINEAIELSKIYCQENSAGFINGVLAKIL